MEINYYNLFKFFHIVFFTTWMAGLFYLPRLYVYHSGIKRESPEYKIFITMEKKLMKYIMNPSMVLTWLFGVLLVLHLEIYNQVWLNLKFVLVFLMSVFHMYCAKIRKNFENKINRKDEKFFRWINEVPTILFLLIVFLVVFQPNIWQCNCNEI